MTTRVKETLSVKVETPLQRALSFLAWGAKHTECSTCMPHECVIALLEHIEELESAAEAKIATDAETLAMVTRELAEPESGSSRVLVDIATQLEGASEFAQRPWEHQCCAAFPDCLHSDGIGTLTP